MGILKRDVSAKSGRGAVTIIARGNHLKGDMDVSGKIHVDGIFEGNIESADDITIGRHGVVRGRISARHVNVSGVLEGDLCCASLHIEKGGQVRAIVLSDYLSIDPQGCFLGERRLQHVPAQLEYHPVSSVAQDDDVLDYALIGALPDRITLSREKD
ncbi:MAG: polymer-forming cytoskeletal protein [Oceanospirillales bacterium]|nr:polymer-forming cytoskeletal protein [Oceanospirillales bacterium]